MSESYNKTLCLRLGRSVKDAGIVIGALIIKHKLSVSDGEMVEPERKTKSVKAIDDDKDDDAVSNSGDVGHSDAATAIKAAQFLADEQPRYHGKLILDVTVAEQAIGYPTDLELLNEAREKSMPGEIGSRVPASSSQTGIFTW